MAQRIAPAAAATQISPAFLHDFGMFNMLASLWRNARSGTQDSKQDSKNATTEMVPARRIDFNQFAEAAIWIFRKPCPQPPARRRW
jgi:hypothetical protein